MKGKQKYSEGRKQQFSLSDYLVKNFINNLLCSTLKLGQKITIFRKIEIEEH